MEWIRGLRIWTQQLGLDGICIINSRSLVRKRMEPTYATATRLQELLEMYLRQIDDYWSIGS
jgi:hypothetical protein